MQAPQVSGSSHKTVLLSSTPTSDANCKSQVVHCTSDPLAINRDSLLGINSLLEWLIELRETLGLTILVIKGMISDVGEHLRKRDTYIMWGRAGSFVPSLGSELFSSSMCSAAQKLSEPRACGIFMAASSCRHVWSLTQFPAPLLFLKDREWG